MIVVDVESSGVDSRLCSLLSIGAVEFENPSNQFYVECKLFPGAHCEKEAFEVNGFTLEEVQSKQGSEQKSLHAEDGGAPLATDEQAGFKKGGNKKSDKEAVEAFLSWMQSCKEWTLAGQNPSFDRDFLLETAHRYHIDWPLAQRTLDLHSVAFFECMKTGKEIPRKNNHSALNLDAILELVGVPVKRKFHNALEDAKLEAEAFSRFVAGKPLFEEYAGFPVPRA